MKIKTNRNWQLTIKKEEDCIELMEHHDGSEGTPYVVIPVESIDAVVLELLKFKAKQKEWEDTF